MSAVLERVAGSTRTVLLSEAVEINPKPDRGLLSDELDVSFVPMAMVEAGAGNIDATTVRKYAEVKKGYTYFRDGDVLFAKITPCMENGKIAVARHLRNGIGFGSTEFHVLRSREGVDPHYIYHFVAGSRFRAEAAHHMTGAVGQKRVPISFLDRAEIPLPPIEDQRRIVAEIEKQFSRLDEAVVNLKRVKANLKRYKAAVLKAAVEGRLVPTEAELARRNGRSYETGDQVLQRILETRRGQWGGKGKYKEPGKPRVNDRLVLPVGWCWVSIEAIAFVTKLAGFEYTKYVEYSAEGDLAVIKAENASRNGFKRTEFSRIKSNTVTHLTRSQLRQGDLLMVFVGAGTGNVARVPDDQPYFLGPNISMIRIESDEVLPEYLELFLRSPPGNSLALSFAKAVAQPSLSMGTIRMIPVAVPPLREQHRVVDELHRRLSLLAQVDVEVDANLKRAERLRQGVLNTAFSGRSHGIESPERELVSKESIDVSA